jgi:hypothetical protein
MLPYFIKYQEAQQWLKDTAVITPLIGNVVHVKWLDDKIFISR